METVNTHKALKLSRIVNYNGFQKAWNSLPNDPIIVLNVRRELLKRLHWSRSSFTIKRSGESPLRENEIPVIQEIFARYGLNAWTGEKI
jgi:hypothetical protein